MPAHPWKPTPLLLTILALLYAPAWAGALPPQPRLQPAKKGELARQWKEVRARYPQVAAAQLEVIESQIELVARLQGSNLCELPALAQSRLCRDECRNAQGGGSTTPPPCPRCRPASGPDDMERYLSCLEERINCLT
ncbi:MAG: hypothetical protein ACLGI9_18390 [Thermoanaerobaculia bacterium]